MKVEGQFMVGRKVTVYARDKSRSQSSIQETLPIKEERRDTSKSFDVLLNYIFECNTHSMVYGGTRGRKDFSGEEERNIDRY